MNDWRVRAACRSVPAEMFFPEGRRNGDERAEQVVAALAVCRRCTVRRACARDALIRKSPHGVRAGVDLGENTNGRTLRDAEHRALRRIAEGA